MRDEKRGRYGLIPVVSPQAMQRLRDAGCLDELDAKIAQCDREIEAAIAGSSPDHDPAQMALCHMGEMDWRITKEDLLTARAEIAKL